MKTINLIFRVLILFLCISCTKKKEGEQKPGLLSNFVSITDNEDKGIKKILSYYDGYCKYSVGTTSSTKSGTSRFFKLEMSQSTIIEEYENNSQLPASNMAYLFYNELNDDEKAKYDEIRSVLIFADGIEKSFSYLTTDLEIVTEKMKLVYKIVDLIDATDFERIEGMLNDDSVLDYNKEELLATMIKLDPTFGEIEEFRPLGFEFKEINNKEILHISEVLMRSQQNMSFSVDFDAKSTENEVLLINYEL